MHQHHAESSRTPVGRTGSGVLKYYNPAKEIWLIEPDAGGKPVLLRGPCLRASGFPDVRENQKIIFEIIGDNSYEVSRVVNIYP